MLCTLCRKHNETSKRMIWLTISCELLQNDKVREHERSQCRIYTVSADAVALAARHSGGIHNVWKIKYHCSGRQYLEHSSVFTGLLGRRQHIILNINHCYTWVIH